MIKKTVQILLSSFFLASIVTVATGATENEIIVPVSAEAEIVMEHYPAKGKYLVLWLAPEYGFREGHRTLARMLTQQNIEVWQGNIVESLFLPQGSSSIKKLKGKYVAEIIEYAHKITGKKIIVVGDSYAALTALYGLHQWQQRKQTTPYVIGAILFTPYAYATIPPLGQLPQYMPIISATNIPLMIYQSEKSSNIGQFDNLVKKLQQHGNPVFTKITPKVMSMFYEENITTDIKNKLKSLPVNMLKMIELLEKYKVPQKPVALTKAKTIKRGIDSYLKKYQGKITPAAINLTDTNGKKIIKNNFKGQITVINFWATWCPPCVQEIPSLNRLKKKMQGLPFELISINYAEEKQTIADFLKKVNVEFPVLLDQDGAFAKKWNVITYPSTFVIDKQGEIKYGVNAAIEWDNPEFTNKIKSLL